MLVCQQHWKTSSSTSERQEIWDQYWNKEGHDAILMQCSQQTHTVAKAYEKIALLRENNIKTKHSTDFGEH